jgi:hypothetical protein
MQVRQSVSFTKHRKYLCVTLIILLTEHQINWELNKQAPVAVNYANYYTGGSK